MISGKNYLLLTVAGGSFVAPFMVSGLIVAIPTIGYEFSMDPVAQSWLATAFFLAAAMFLIPFGRISDLLGVKRIFSVGIGIFFISALLASLAPNPSVLIAARFLAGMGAAMVFGTSFAILSLSLPEGERGRALGMNIAANLLGFALGFLIGGYLTHYLTWRALFAATLPIDLLVIALLHLKLPGDYALSKCKGIDLAGTVLCAVMLFFIVVGLSELPGLLGISALLIGLITLIAFSFWEMRAPCPIVDVRLFLKNRAFALFNLSILIYFASSFASIFLFSLYLQYIRGFDERSAGVTFAALTLVMAFFVIYAGRLSDRIRPAHIAAVGAAMTSVGLFPLMFISTTTPIELVISESTLLLVGGAFFQPPIVKCVIGSLGRDMYGLGGGLAEMMRLAGQTVSMAVVIVFFTLYLGGWEILPESHPAFIESLRTIFAVFLVLSLSCLAIVVLVGRSEDRCV